MAVASLTWLIWLSAIVSARTLHLTRRTSTDPLDIEAISTSTDLGDIEACSSTNKFCEAARPRFHFTSATNWLNDPNGLHYYEGVYHMFFQHTRSKVWDKEIFWGHAVSTDLLHWHQLDDALVPEEGGAWSGSAVVDVANTSGLQSGSKPVVVAFYTHVDYKTRGHQQHWESSQRLVYSNDASKTFVSDSPDGDVMVPTLEGDRDLARDPKVFWHEASNQWIMVLWEGPGNTGLYSSKTLRSWNKIQDLKVDGFECPDFFELKVDGENTRKWVLIFASSQYYIGTFDGKRFEIEGEPRKVEYGRGYAAQTFDNVPNGRRVQVSWIVWKSPLPKEQEKLPFMGSMSVPMEMDLIRLKDGTIGVRRLPVSELTNLWQDLPSEGIEAIRKISGTKKLAGEKVIATSKGLGLDIEIDVKLDADSSLAFSIQGQRVNLTAGEVTSEHQQSDPLCEPHCLQRLPVDGDRLKLRILSDRSSLEIFDLVSGTSMATITSSSQCDWNRWITEIHLMPSGSVNVKDLQVHEISDRNSLCRKFAES